MNFKVVTFNNKQVRITCNHCSHNGSLYQSGLSPKALGSTVGNLFKSLFKQAVKLFSGCTTLSKYFMQHKCTYKSLNSFSFGTLFSQGNGGFDNSLGVPGKFLFQSRLWCAQ